MSRAATHLWSQGEVVTLHRPVIGQDFKSSEMFKYLYCPSVDTYTSDSGGKYGMWQHEGGGWLATVSWEPQALERFPPEFRMHLLLLGVPT